MRDLPCKDFLFAVGKEKGRLGAERDGEPCHCLWIHIWPPWFWPLSNPPELLAEKMEKPKKRAQALGSCSRCTAENASLFRVQLFHFPLLAPGIPVHKHFVGKKRHSKSLAGGKELMLMVDFSVFRVGLRLHQSLGLPCSDNGQSAQVLE